jgi:hypothetical protein
MSRWHPLRVSGNGLRESGKHAAGGEALLFPGHRKASFGIGVKTYMEAFQADESAMRGNNTCGMRTHAATRGDPIGLAGRRLNRSAKMFLQLRLLPRPVPLREHAYGPVRSSCWPAWHAGLYVKG